MDQAEEIVGEISFIEEVEDHEQEKGDMGRNSFAHIKANTQEDQVISRDNESIGKDDR